MSLFAKLRSVNLKIPFSLSFKNVFWNFLGVSSSGILIIFITPVYIKQLGLELYGILSLWLILQVLMSVFDLGFGATLVKELAKTYSHLSDKIYERNLLRTLEFIYWILSFLIVVLLMSFSSWISNNWLKIESLSFKEVADLIILMSISLGLQFPFSLYSNGLSGIQKQFQLNVLVIIGNLLRHVVGVSMVFIFNDLKSFFIAQIVISFSTTIISRILLWKNLSSSHIPKINFKILSGLTKFSLGMALTTIVSVIMANADRLILSKMTLLSDLGIYAVAFTATGVLQLIIQPFYRAYYPVYSQIVANGDKNSIQKEYFDSTKLFSVFYFPVSLSVLFFAPQLFEIWIGKFNSEIILIFRLLVVGITFSGLTWLPVAFQQANGWSTLHFVIILASLIIGVPLSIFAIGKFGVIGATSLWLLHGFLDFTLCIWLMHSRLLKGQYFLWLRESVIFQFSLSLILLFVCYRLRPNIDSKIFQLFYISFSGILALGLNFMLRNLNVLSPKQFRTADHLV